ncbi:MAG: hypothetical protein WBX15_02645, partial [Thermoanaerobaculia bacterium]
RGASVAGPVWMEEALLQPQGLSRSDLNAVVAADQRIRAPRAAGLSGVRFVRSLWGADHPIRDGDRVVRDEERACG